MGSLALRRLRPHIFGSTCVKNGNDSQLFAAACTVYRFHPAKATAAPDSVGTIAVPRRSPDATRGDFYASFAYLIALQLDEKNVVALHWHS